MNFEDELLKTFTTDDNEVLSEIYDENMQIETAEYPYLDLDILFANCSGAGANCAGAGTNCAGAGANCSGTGANCAGAGANCAGAGANCAGTSCNFTANNECCIDEIAIVRQHDDPVRENNLLEGFNLSNLNGKNEINLSSTNDLNISFKGDNSHGSDFSRADLGAVPNLNESGVDVEFDQLLDFISENGLSESATDLNDRQFEVRCTRGLNGASEAVAIQASSSGGDLRCRLVELVAEQDSSTICSDGALQELAESYHEEQMIRSIHRECPAVLLQLCKYIHRDDAFKHHKNIYTLVNSLSSGIPWLKKNEVELILTFMKDLINTRSNYFENFLINDSQTSPNVVQLLKQIVNSLSGSGLSRYEFTQASRAAKENVRQRSDSIDWSRMAEFEGEWVLDHTYSPIETEQSCLEHDGGHTAFNTAMKASQGSDDSPAALPIPDGDPVAAEDPTAVEDPVSVEDLVSVGVGASSVRSNRRVAYPHKDRSLCDSMCFTTFGKVKFSVYPGILWGRELLGKKRQLLQMLKNYETSTGLKTPLFCEDVLDDLDLEEPLKKIRRQVLRHNRVCRKAKFQDYKRRSNGVPFVQYFLRKNVATRQMTQSSPLFAADDLSTVSNEDETRTVHQANPEAMETESSAVAEDILVLEETNSANEVTESEEVVEEPPDVVEIHEQQSNIVCETYNTRGKTLSSASQWTTLEPLLTSGLPILTQLKTATSENASCPRGIDTENCVGVAAMSSGKTPRENGLHKQRVVLPKWPLLKDSSTASLRPLHQVAISSMTSDVNNNGRNIQVSFQPRLAVKQTIRAPLVTRQSSSDISLNRSGPWIIRLPSPTMTPNVSSTNPSTTGESVETSTKKKKPTETSTTGEAVETRIKHQEPADTSTIGEAAEARTKNQEPTSPTSSNIRAIVRQAGLALPAVDRYSVHYTPPLRYDFRKLQIGDFHVQPRGGLARLKIFYSSRMLVYIFDYPILQDRSERGQRVHIEVKFSHIVGLQSHSGVLSVYVSHVPRLLIGRHAVLQHQQGSPAPQAPPALLPPASPLLPSDHHSLVQLVNGPLTYSPLHQLYFSQATCDVIRNNLSRCSERLSAMLTTDLASLLTHRATDDLTGHVPRWKLLPSAHEVTANPTAFEPAAAASDNKWMTSGDNSGCNCTYSCRSLSCACSRASMPCNYGTRSCCCPSSKCGNTFNTLLEEGINVSIAREDTCLVQNLYAIRTAAEVRRLLNSRLPCPHCCGLLAVRDMVPMERRCSHCHRSAVFSWCRRTLAVARNHCLVCIACSHVHFQHCLKCKKCTLRKTLNGACSICSN